MCHFLQSNGLDERFNQTIQSMLVKFVNERKSNWDEHLDSCSFAYNTARHDSTKFSPFELMFGRKALLPIQLETNGDDPNKVLHEFQNAPALDENSALLEKLIEGRSALIEEAKANIETAQEKQCEHYNQKHANPEAFLVGSKVLVKDFTRRKRQGGKMDFRWLGPYTIEKNLGKGTYLLRCDAGESSKLVNGAHMKPYFNPPDGSNQPPNDTNTTSNDRPFDPPSTDNDTNPPDDELDVLEDDSFHHNSPFDNSQADLEIKEPEDNTKEPEIAEPGDKSEPETNKEPKSVEPGKPEDYPVNFGVHSFCSCYI